MYKEITNIPGNSCPKHYPGNPQYELHQLQTARLTLTSELYRTNGLIQAITEYINERHTIYFPLYRGSGKGKERVWANAE